MSLFKTQIKASAQSSKAPQKTTQQKALNYSSPLQDVEEIKKAFDSFDYDSSGFVRLHHLQSCLVEMKYSGYSRFRSHILAEPYEEYPQRMNFSEFLQFATAHLTNQNSRNEISKIWASFDLNCAGKITAFQLRKVARDLGEDLNQGEIEEMFSKADLDDDGFVSGQDFYNMMTGQVYW